MWDLKLNNACNHRIINEPLDIKGSYSTYYAILKRPVYGDNLKITVVDEDNLFAINPTLIDYVLGNDRQTLIFNQNRIQVDVRPEIYPQHTYYATYTTDLAHCPKCIYGTNRTNDIYIDVLGRPILTAGLELLIQKIKKILITAIQSNLFDETYGSELPNLIGKPKTVLTLLKAQNTIQNAIEHIKIEQMANYDLLSDDEKLLKIDNFQVMPTDNPKVLKFSFEVYNLAGKNVNIGVSI
jgi:phage baseplate assembly protein W